MKQARKKYLFKPSSREERAANVVLWNFGREFSSQMF